MTTRRTLSFLALLGAGALALAGCASAATPEPTETAGAGAGIDAPAWEVDAAWIDGGRQIVLVTEGSSTCIPFAGDVTVEADGTVAVTLQDAEGDVVCTRDLVPRPTLVSLPDGIEAGKDVNLVVTYGDLLAETSLEVYAGPPAEEYMPSVALVSADQLAILTWGSSSCAPLVQDAALDGETVTVAFVEPPADKVCTMDMAPRVVLAQVEGADTASSVTLTGGGVEFATPVTVSLV